MAEKILCRTVIEVLGRPKEHVEKAIKEYIQSVKKDERYHVLREEFAEIKKQENDFWATFTEMEMEIKDVRDLITFCFDYMPSIVEILKPTKITLTDKDFSDFFNDLQARLHEVDMVAKQVKMENDHLQLNLSKLLKNYLVVLLGKDELTLEKLGKLTGIKEEMLGDFLDKLIDEKLIRMEGGIYSLNNEKLKEKA